jgi:hypothetical protein
MPSAVSHRCRLGFQRTRRNGEEGELKVRGHARSEKDSGVQRRYADAVAQALGWKPEPGHFHLFAVDIDHLSYLKPTFGSAGSLLCLVTGWPLLKRPHVAVGVTEI